MNRKEVEEKKKQQRYFINVIRQNIKNEKQDPHHIMINIFIIVLLTLLFIFC